MVDVKHPPDCDVAINPEESCDGFWDELQLPSSYCYEVEQQRLELENNLFFLKDQLKQLKCKAILYENIMGGLDCDYSHMIPSEIDIKSLSNKYNSIVDAKNEFRSKNLQCISDIETLISKLLIYHQNLKNALHLPEDVKLEKLEAETRNMAKQFEARLQEHDEYRQRLYKLSGISLISLSECSANFSVCCNGDYNLKIDWELAEHPKLKSAIVDPTLFIEDIVQVAVEDNNLNFLFRELTNRIYSVDERRQIIKKISENQNIRVQEDSEQILTVSVCSNSMDEPQDFVFSVKIRAPLEIEAPLKILNVQTSSNCDFNGILDQLGAAKNIKQFADLICKL